jgi:hypothetical protein
MVIRVDGLESRGSVIWLAELSRDLRGACERCRELLV